LPKRHRVGKGAIGLGGDHEVRGVGERVWEACGEVDGQILVLRFAQPCRVVVIDILNRSRASNYELEGQLDTVCDAIEIPDDFSFDDKPKTDLEKAQNICAARTDDTGDMPED